MEARNAVLLSMIVAFGVFNVTLMMAYAHSLFGRTPFSLIFFFLGVSGVGVVCSFPVFLALRRFGFTWIDGAIATAIFVVLALFNYWILLSWPSDVNPFSDDDSNSAPLFRPPLADILPD